MFIIYVLSVKFLSFYICININFDKIGNDNSSFNVFQILEKRIWNLKFIIFCFLISFNKILTIIFFNKRKRKDFHFTYLKT